jgi:hypothetical protein
VAAGGWVTEGLKYIYTYKGVKLEVIQQTLHSKQRFENYSFYVNAENSLQSFLHTVQAKTLRTA